MVADVVFTISPKGMKALRKQIKAGLQEAYEFLDTADRYHEFEGYQLWEWSEITWGEEIHGLLRHGLAEVPNGEFRLITQCRETGDQTCDGLLTGPFDVMAGTVEQGFPNNWIHVDVGYAKMWDEFGGSGDGIAPLGQQGCSE